MKRFLILFSTVLFFFGCDDGDISVTDAIRLDDALIVKCNFNTILYKIKDDQALLLEIADLSTAFENKEANKTPINISPTTNKLLFRTYNGTVKASNVCGTTFDINPTVKEEWIAQAGVIEIVTTVRKSEPNTTTNATTILGYRHVITLKNITWLKPDGATQLDNFGRTFGVYDTNVTTNLPFGFQENSLVFKSTCPTDNTLVAKSGSESMRLKLAPTSYAALFTPATTLPNAPKSKPITVENTLTYNFFSGLIALSDFCIPLPNTRPATLETWTANVSSGATNGIVEVETTTETSASVKHTIFLRGVTFGNGNVDFYYGDRIKFGFFIEQL